MKRIFISYLMMTVKRLLIIYVKEWKFIRSELVKNFMPLATQVENFPIVLRKKNVLAKFNFSCNGRHWTDYRGLSHWFMTLTLHILTFTAHTFCNCYFIIHIWYIQNITGRNTLNKLGNRHFWKWILIFGILIKGLGAQKLFLRHDLLNKWIVNSE